MTSSKTIFVAPGEIIMAQKEGVLTSTPLGSCIACIAYHKFSGTGGMAHIMLPGNAPDMHINDKNRYAHNAIDDLICQFATKFIPINEILVFLIGGANVLKKENDTLVEAITTSVINKLKQNNLTVTASSLGGYERHGAVLDLNREIIFFSIGNNHKEILYNFKD